MDVRDFKVDEIDPKVLEQIKHEIHSGKLCGIKLPAKQPKLDIATPTTPRRSYRRSLAEQVEEILCQHPDLKNLIAGLRRDEEAAFRRWEQQRAEKLKQLTSRLGSAALSGSITNEDISKLHDSSQCELHELDLKIHEELEKLFEQQERVLAGSEFAGLLRLTRDEDDIAHNQAVLRLVILL